MSLDITRTVYRTMCEAVDSPRSLACWLLYDSSEFEQLVRLDIDPANYGSDRRDIFRFQADYQVTSYLQKNDFLKTGIDTKRQALLSFHKGEEDCLETNRIFRLRAEGLINFTPRVERAFLRAQRQISKWLTGYDFETTITGASHGPGVTSTLKGSNATNDTKVFDLSSYPKAASWLKFDLCHSPEWRKALAEHGYEQFPIITDGNRVTTVPKKSTTDRTIGIEATQMIFYQKAIGAELRRRLRRVGCDLNDATLNQRLALFGSQTGEITTEDLKNASNSIALELVFNLFPIDIALHLDTFRAPSYFCEEKKTYVKYQMFSSMGNGYTFELESMIFLAFARSVVPKRDWHLVNVFGDDIIVPSYAIKDLRELLYAVGFKSNVDKSFSEGYFRESCGKHYFDGIDVTPIYQKKEFSSSIVECINAVNRLLKAEDSIGLSLGYVQLRRFCLKKWPETPLLPQELDLDGGIQLKLQDDLRYGIVQCVKGGIRRIRRLVFVSLEIRPNYLGRLLYNYRHGVPTAPTRGTVLRGKGCYIVKMTPF